MSSATDVRDDRRRSRRVDALGRVGVIVHSRPLLALLRDINNTGFTLETALPVDVGETHRFELRFPSSRAVVDATCTRCVPNANWVEGTYEAGFAFDGLEGPPRMVVTHFIDHLAAETADGQ